jgi:hypothetical protein
MISPGELWIVTLPGAVSPLARRPETKNCPEKSQNDARAGSRAEYLWLRLVYSDRILSLMLDLPVTVVADNSFASEYHPAADVPLGELERIHTVIMGRITARNERMRRSGQYCAAAYDDYKETQDTDYNLKRAARALPTKWWTLPATSNTAMDVNVLEETARPVTQLVFVMV